MVVVLVEGDGKGREVDGAMRGGWCVMEFEGVRGKTGFEG